jgi:hypothetical protein
MNTPWAVLKCKFNDNRNEPFPDAVYRRLFTREGLGSQNMVDYFYDWSHGRLDLSDSEVFGWYTLDRPRNDYTEAFALRGFNARNELVAWARGAATAAGIDLGRFFGVVICFNVQTDLFGGWMGGPVAVCDQLSLTGSQLAQEMGHGYGLSHSRAEGSSVDYRDPWDAMSTMTAFVTRHSEWGYVGPGLNAWNMRGRGWLEESRVWRGHRFGYTVEVELRSLRRRDVPGLLAAEVGREFLVEFRMNDAWDARFQEPVVLVHRFEGNQSYVMRGRAGWFDLSEGDTFEIGMPDNPFTDYTRVDVLNIDPGNHSAKLGITYRPGRKPELARFGGQLLDRVAADGGGAIIVNGRIIPIPPWDPTFRILEYLSAVRAGAEVSPTWAGKVIQREALEAMVKEIAQLRRSADLLSIPAAHVELDEHGFPKDVDRLGDPDKKGKGA